MVFQHHKIKIMLKRMFINGKINGNPLQYSCLENPMDRGAWWGPWGPKESDVTENNYSYKNGWLQVRIYIFTHSQIIYIEKKGGHEVNQNFDISW